MQYNEARALREQRFKLIKDARALDDKGNLSREDQARFDKMMADADAMKARIDILEGASMAEIRGGTIEHEQGGGTGTAKEKAEEYRTAFRSFLKHGREGLSNEERAIITEHRDMGTGGGNALQGTGGGYFVPVGFVTQIEEATKYYGPMLQTSKLMDTATGQPLPYPTSNDTTVVGERIGEGQQVTDNDVTLSNVIFGAFKYSTKMVKCSIELLQDSAFNIEDFLIEQFGIRLGRIINTETTLGTGSVMPNGIIPSSVFGAAAIGSSGNTGGAETGGTSIGSDDLTELEHSVDISYRTGAKYMMHDSTLKKLKQLKDKFGRPIWQAGLSVKEPDTISGYAYAINNDMDTLPTQVSSPPVVKKTMLFGQLSKYTIRRVREMSVLRLTERFADCFSPAV